MDVASNPIKSSFSKGLLVFLIVMWALTLGFGVLTYFLIKDQAFAVFSYIFCGVFHVIAIIVIIDTLTSYVIVEGNKITKHVFLSKRVVKIKKITKIIHVNGAYVIYVDQRKFVTLNDRDPQTSKMLFQFERNGIDIGKIEDA